MRMSLITAPLAFRVTCGTIVFLCENYIYYRFFSLHFFAQFATITWLDGNTETRKIDTK